MTQNVNCTWKIPEPLEDAKTKCVIDGIECTDVCGAKNVFALQRQEDFLVQLVFRYSSTEGLGPLPPLPLPPAAGIFQVAYVDEDLLVQRTAGDSSLNVLLRETGPARDFA